MWQSPPQQRSGGMYYFSGLEQGGSPRAPSPPPALALGSIVDGTASVAPGGATAAYMITLHQTVAELTARNAELTARNAELEGRLAVMQHAARSTPSPQPSEKVSAGSQTELTIPFFVDQRNGLSPATPTLHTPICRHQLMSSFTHTVAPTDMLTVHTAPPTTGVLYSDLPHGWRRSALTEPSRDVVRLHSAAPRAFPLQHPPDVMRGVRKRRNQRTRQLTRESDDQHIIKCESLSTLGALNVTQPQEDSRPQTPTDAGEERPSCDECSPDVYRVQTESVLQRADQCLSCQRRSVSLADVRPTLSVGEHGFAQSVLSALSGPENGSATASGGLSEVTPSSAGGRPEVTPPMRPYQPPHNSTASMPSLSRGSTHTEHQLAENSAHGRARQSARGPPIELLTPDDGSGHLGSLSPQPIGLGGPSPADAAATPPPCAHNDWDSVRARKGTVVYRCRQCQQQWRTALSRVTRCKDFWGGRCTFGAGCAHLHVHRTKQSSEERRELQRQRESPPPVITHPAATF